MTEAKVELMLSEDGEEGYESRNSGGLKKLGKGKEMDCPIDSLELPYEHLAFISMSPILDF